MTIGIYCISFKNTDKVYIGQSTNIETRWADHYRTMRKGTAKRKLQEAYTEYGEPIFTILVECSIDELDREEISLITEFDSIKTGLNTCSGGKSGAGVHNGSSIFTKEQLLQVLELLSDDRVLLYSDITSIVDVTYNTVVNISKGVSHSWLSELYPDMFKKQESLNILRQAKAHITIGGKASAKNLGIYYPILVTPDGTECSIDNALQFANANGLDHSCLVKVLNGYRKSHKGYFLKHPQEKPQKEKKIRPLILSPLGDVMEITTSLVEFADTYNLNSSSLSGLLSGRIKTLKGWSIYKLKNLDLPT